MMSAFVMDGKISRNEGEIEEFISTVSQSSRGTLKLLYHFLIILPAWRSSCILPHPRSGKQRYGYVKDTDGFIPQVPAFNDINDWLYPLGGCLYYFSTTVNPILYNVMSIKYRLAFKKTLHCATTSPTITRDDLSSIKESGSGSKRGSQVVRVRSVHYQRSFKCNVSLASEMPRSLIRLRYDDKDEDANHCDVERMPCDILGPDAQLTDTRRSSFVARSNNSDRTKYQSGERTKDSVSLIAMSETCIRSLAYPDRERKKCCDMRTTCIHEELPCHFRIRDETDVTDTAQYPALKDNFQRQMCHDILPGERSRDEKLSFVESCV